MPVSKMEELIRSPLSGFLKTVKDPDRRPYPALPSGKSWCEACGKDRFREEVSCTTSCQESISQQKHSSSTRATSINPPSKQCNKEKERKRRVKERRNEEVRKEGKRMGERGKKRG